MSVVSFRPSPVPGGAATSKAVTASRRDAATAAPWRESDQFLCDAVTADAAQAEGAPARGRLQEAAQVITGAAAPVPGAQPPVSARYPDGPPSPVLTAMVVTLAFAPEAVHAALEQRGGA